MKIVSAIWTLIGALGATCVAAQPARDGVLDPSFGTGGIVRLDQLDGGDVDLSRPRGLILQPDGKLLLVGEGRRVSAGFATRPVVVRLLADGALDTTFGTGGVYVLPASVAGTGVDAVANTAAILPDGKIVVVGAIFESFQFEYRRCVVMFALDSTGALLPGYGPGPGPTCLDFGGGSTLVYAPFGSIVVDGDGVLVAGLSGVSPPEGAAVARLDAAGALDASFGTGGFRHYAGSGAFAKPNGRPGILRQGGALLAMAASGLARGALRTNPPGVPDATYGNSGFGGVQWPGAAAINEVESMALDGSGSLLLLGIVRDPQPNPQVCDYCLTRLTATGAIDTTFNAAGTLPGGPGSVLIDADASPSATSTFPMRVVARADGRVLMTGSIQPPGQAAPDLYFISLQSDGTIDARFGSTATPGRLALQLAAPPGEFDGIADALETANGRVVVAAMCNFAGVVGFCAARLVDDHLFADSFEAPLR